MTKKISVNTLNNIVRAIAHIELLTEVIDEISLDDKFYLHKVKMRGKAFHEELLKEIEHFWKGLDAENQSKYSKEVEAIKQITDKLIKTVNEKK